MRRADPGPTTVVVRLSVWRSTCASGHGHGCGLTEAGDEQWPSPVAPQQEARLGCSMTRWLQWWPSLGCCADSGIFDLVVTVRPAPISLPITGIKGGAAVSGCWAARSSTCFQCFLQRCGWALGSFSARIRLARRCQTVEIAGSVGFDNKYAHSPGENP